MDKQKLHWEKAGRKGYGKTIFSNSAVERHIRATTWNAAMIAAKTLGLDSSSRILELGCGDGDFTINVLGENFRSIDAFDRSVAAIERARSLCDRQSVNFYVHDAVKLDHSSEQSWDGAFLMGLLHHMKQDTPSTVSQLAKVAPKVVVAEPNGNNILRRGLELLPSYRVAGEQSFRAKQLISIFESAGYTLIHRDLISSIPPFTPAVLLPMMIWIEKIVASFSILKRINSTYIFAFRLKNFKD